MTIAAVVIAAVALIAFAVYATRPPAEQPTHWESMHASHEDRAATERRLQWFEKQWESARHDGDTDEH